MFGGELLNFAGVTAVGYKKWEKQPTSTGRGWYQPLEKLQTM